MQVREAMSTPVTLATPDQTIQQAARLMLEADSGVLPVGDKERLVGMITDRDIALRAVASGKGPKTPVREVMTGEVKYCFEDEDIEHVARNMGEEQVRRLPVVDRDKKLVGILSLGDVATLHSGGAAGTALGDISHPGGKHSHG
ncbi:CBS domain-containing protein [Enhydrobacter aerosaccus]|uniref:CBS domain-containing protein n=1 Tax=Enhydrobacter aerosaccus TaxID=225324 RepID=A0A1T4SGQ5_9HYPH|nr:CBS domain-containing protein [Enhydrobacter aerosaccus]SKA27359.1 CBS domain-containing protein [Enhydrobacter aerosaccus]